MKLPGGKTVYYGGRKYRNEIPDEIAALAGLKLTTEPVASKSSGKSAEKSGK